MKGKALMKPCIKRAQTRLIAFSFSVLFAANILGCFYLPATIPEGVRGLYRTTHREYDDQFFELDSSHITMGFGGGKYKYYNVERVEKEIIDYKILYTILCSNEAEGEEFNFSFFVYFSGEVIVHFKNKPQVLWKKQKKEISHNAKSDTQIRH